MADWTTLDELPAGTLFETREGVQALKTEYSDDLIGADRRHYPQPRCYLLGSGELVDWQGAHASEIDVRELWIEGSSFSPHATAAPSTSLLNRPCTLAVTAGSSRFGTVVSQDERGIWFCGKMERDNPKERERTYFVPWTSVVWMEMEEE